MPVQFIFLLVATHTTLDVVSAKLKLILLVVAIQSLCIGLHCPKSFGKVDWKSRKVLFEAGWSISNMDVVCATPCYVAFIDFSMHALLPVCLVVEWRSSPCRVDASHNQHWVANRVYIWLILTTPDPPRAQSCVIRSVDLGKPFMTSTNVSGSPHFTATFSCKGTWSDMVWTFTDWSTFQPIL